MEKIRSFIAIELNEVIKKDLAQLQNKLKATGADIKWVKPENIHLTLKFLGHIDKNKLNQIKQVLDKTASRHKLFEISLFKIGCFPNLDYPRVVWVGIDKNCSEIEGIAKELEDELEKVGFEKEKRSFSAHLTLGRFRSSKGKSNLVEKIKELDFKSSSEMNVVELVLFQSTLTPQGPNYNALYNSKLRD